MSKKTLTVGGTDLSAFGVYIDTALSYNKPRWRYQMVSIPGRSGDLVLFERAGGAEQVYDNVIITYPAYINENFASNWADLINRFSELPGYVTIRCSDDPTHYREGVIIMPEVPKVKNVNQKAFFDLSFNCKPQRFLNSGDNPVSISVPNGGITNPTLHTAYPIIKVTGTVTLSFDGGDRVVTITGTQAETYIDCEDMTCYDEYLQSVNKYVTITGGKYPVLWADEVTSIAASGGITAVEITPRWWEL